MIRRPRPEDDQYALHTFVRRVYSVPEPGMRRRQVQRHLATVDADVAAEHVQAVLTRALAGSPEAREVLMAVVAHVESAEGADAGRLDAIDLAARATGHAGVPWLLIDPPPWREVDHVAFRHGRGRAMTLGARRSAAAGHDRAQLERLLADPHPLVVDRLAGNPRINEAEILTIVTKRPTRADALRTVAKHPRWFGRQTIREAIVQNPFAPTGLALRMLPLVPAATIERARHAAELHPAISMFARYLVALRQGDDVSALPGADDLHAELQRDKLGGARGR